MKNTMQKHAVMVGGGAVIFYALCLVWRLWRTDVAVEALHLNLFKLAFPGFSGYDSLSIIWGAVLIFVYGFIASTVYHAIHRNCCDVKK